MRPGRENLYFQHCLMFMVENRKFLSKSINLAIPVTKNKVFLGEKFGKDPRK